MRGYFFYFQLAILQKKIKTEFMNMTNRSVLNKGLKVVIVLFGLQSFCHAQTAANVEDDWFKEDPQVAFDAINDGELNFLQTPPRESVHHHQNTLIVDKSSLRDGWVKLQQCHENLDEFPSAQIVYNKIKVKNIRITEYTNIERAWVEDSSVQLKHIAPKAKLCIEADTRALWPQADGSFEMRNGPFMRKFLDGYFPMRVTIDIELPENLEFSSMTPIEQPGLKVDSNNQSIRIDTWFEGKLITRIKFRESSQPPAAFQ